MMENNDRVKTGGISASSEDYLEAIFLLHRRTGYVRSVDIAKYFGYSKPSVSHAVALLEEGCYLIREKSGNLILTETGNRIAELTYEKHCFFKAQLINAGVGQELAEKEACRMEHTISKDSFEKLKKKMDRRDTYKA